MQKRGSVSLMLVCGMVLPAGGGCLRRNEFITVGKNGSIVIKLDFEGDREDLELGDAMPATDTGWEVTRIVEHKVDGKESHILRATQEFVPGQALPASFASPDDPDADLYLTFPTTYRTETRDDGIYHFFHRIYPPRSWAAIHYWEEALIEDRHEELSKKPIEELTLGERRTLFNAFAAVEMYKQLEYVKEALREAAPTLPAETHLRARQALIDVYGSADLGAIAERCINTPDDEARAACFEHETAKLLSDALDAYVTVLTQDAVLDPTQLASLDRAYQRSKRRFELTGTMANGLFEISVSMPGRIVAHNADKLENHGPSVWVEWEFDGRAFRDRTYELIMITREPLADETETESSSHER